jgi:NADPH:quinone reductase-like Zn-dependent oxidoreductase
MAAHDPEVSNICLLREVWADEHIAQMNTTEAWVLRRGPVGAAAPVKGQLERRAYSLSGLSEYDVLVEPLYGCWEANMAHAVARQPIDVCRERNEDEVVLGNSGVVRVVQTGSAVSTTKAGDVCIICGNGGGDERGYMKLALAYDAPGSMGVLARRARLHERNVVPIPAKTRHSLKQWAAFSLRYVTAWSNWKVAYGSWRLQMTAEDQATPFVWGWGGGSTLAEVSLAAREGCRTAMISSNEHRLKLIASLGIQPVDRRPFRDLDFDESRYKTDACYREAYKHAENAFLRMVREMTDGHGVSIFVDYIGSPVFRATLRALARQGVLTTAGWKNGMSTSTVRAIECIQRHVHVHTHGARYREWREAMEYAEATGWMPPPSEVDRVYGWDEIPQLACDYANGRIDSYFPIFQVNPL